jgi:hypothetical protein
MMKPGDSLRLLSGLYDLPMIDKDGCYCGIVDDVRLAGGPGKPLAIDAILCGPGAYGRRLPRWARAIVQHLAGERITAVPWSEVADVTTAVHLKKKADDLGLHAAENRARTMIPKKAAL